MRDLPSLTLHQLNLMILKSSEDGLGWESGPEWLETQALNGPSGVVQAPESVMSSFENICGRKDKFSNKNQRKCKLSQNALPFPFDI